MCYIIIHIFEGTYNSFEKINTASNKKQKTQRLAQKDWKMEGDVRWHGSICKEMIIFSIMLNSIKCTFNLRKWQKNTFKYYQDFTQPM